MWWCSFEGLFSISIIFYNFYKIKKKKAWVGDVWVVESELVL